MIETRGSGGLESECKYVEVDEAIVVEGVQQGYRKKRVQVDATVDVIHDLDAHLLTGEYEAVEL